VTCRRGASQRDTNEDGYGNAGDADLNGDEVVNFADLAIMKKSFFKKPEPAAGKR
jgi:hypothetical protein